MKTLLVIFTIMFTLTANGQVHVRGYTRSNGTYVAPHVRSSPNSTPTDNYSYPGNTNPYTGKTATGNPDTYEKKSTNTSNSNSSDVWVDGYYKKDGTYVTGHWRSAPNETATDNYSYPGNTNPYTGKTATGNPETYLKVHSGNESTYYVKSNNLNIRSGPSTNCSVLTSLSYGDDVDVLEFTNTNWKKVKFSYYDINSQTTRSTIGYVYSSYLSSSNPIYDSNYTNASIDYNKLSDNSYNQSIHANEKSTNSNISSTSYHPYGYNNGEITLWTDCSNDGIISVYIDGKYKGQIVTYFDSSSNPKCGENGTLNLTLPVGIYKLTAKGKNNKWKGNIKIVADECQLNQLSK